MKTRVNLYTAEFKPKKELLSFNQMAVVWCFAMLVLLSLYFYTSDQLQSSRQTLVTLQLEEGEKRTELQKLEAKLMAHQASAMLNRELAARKLELEVKRRLLNSLGEKQLLKSQGFAVLMADLAKVNDKEVWLTQVLVTEGNINLSGITTSSDAVPRWVNGFKRVASLAGQGFYQFSVARDENDQLAFELTSDIQDGEQ